MSERPAANMWSQQSLHLWGVSSLSSEQEAKHARLSVECHLDNFVAGCPELGRTRNFFERAIEPVKTAALNLNFSINNFQLACVAAANCASSLRQVVSMVVDCGPGKSTIYFGSACFFGGAKDKKVLIVYATQGLMNKDLA